MAGNDWRCDTVATQRLGQLRGTPKLPHKLGPKLNGYTKSYSKARDDS